MEWPTLAKSQLPGGCSWTCLAASHSSTGVDPKGTSNNKHPVLVLGSPFWESQPETSSIHLSLPLLLPLSLPPLFLSLFLLLPLSVCLSSLFVFNFYDMGVLPACLYTTYVCNASGGQKRAPGNWSYRYL